MIKYLLNAKFCRNIVVSCISHFILSIWLPNQNTTKLTNMYMFIELIQYLINTILANVETTLF